MLPYLAWIVGSKTKVNPYIIWKLVVQNGPRIGQLIAPKGDHFEAQNCQNQIRSSILRLSCKLLQLCTAILAYYLACLVGSTGATLHPILGLQTTLQPGLPLRAKVFSVALVNYF